LNFRHTLSKVEFLFKTKTPAADEAPLRVLVQSVVVEDLNNTGTLKVTSAYPDTERPGEDEVEADAVVYPVSFDWGTTSGEVDFSDDYASTYYAWTWGEGESASNEIELIGGEKVKITTTENEGTKTNTVTDKDGNEVTNFDQTALLLDDEAEVFTTWLMMPQSVEGKKVTVTYIINSRQFSSVFALDKNLTDKKWAVNQHIKYTVTLTPNVISFNPSVEEWEKPATDVEHNN
jgi:hypothetical protein